MYRRTYDLWRLNSFFQPWIVRLLRPSARMNPNFLNLGKTREGGRVDARHLPTKGGLALPIGLSIREFPACIFPERSCASEPRRVATSSRPVPKISGETRRSFHFPNAGNRPTPGGPLALARARKLSYFGSDSAVQEDSRTIKIILENHLFHKAIMGRQSTINPTNSAR